MDPWQAKIKDFQQDIQTKLQMLREYIAYSAKNEKDSASKEIKLSSKEKDLLIQQEKVMTQLLEVLTKRAEIAYPKPIPAPEPKSAETVPHKK